MSYSEKDIKTLIQEFKEIKDLMALKEILWINSKKESFESAIKSSGVDPANIEDAEKRLIRFSSFIKEVFPETEEANGIIESPLAAIPSMKKSLEDDFNVSIPGSLYLKCDSHLPVSGSIKARGGIYAVLKHAEDLALNAGILSIDDDYSCFASEEFRGFFSQYAISVSSTGNLGLSIGIISAVLGFRVTVHMSKDARKWKKDMLRSKGVTVKEYNADFSAAVIEGRKQSEKDPLCFFVDDENSNDLFYGYAVASLRLKKYLESQNIHISKEKPLFVYLPCGVGGGPGGVAFGLKLMFQDNVHCFFAEPTHAPSMLLGILTGLHDAICVQDIGIDNLTAADGLAVGRPSKFVGKEMEKFLSGSYTISDQRMFYLLNKMVENEGIKIEPSGLAGLYGPVQLLKSQEGQQYIEDNGLSESIKNAVHISWATGGSMVPSLEMDEFINVGKAIDINEL